MEQETENIRFVITIRISFIALDFTSKECAFVKLVHNIEHETK